MEYCSHERMLSTARLDYCPDCKYEFYYGDAHADDAKMSKEINPGLPEPPVVEPVLDYYDD